LAVKIRLLRIGRKKKPFYRIVVIDSKVRRDGRYLDKLGTYNPITKPATIEIDEERTLEWLQEGAIPSNTVFNMLQDRGIALEAHLLKNKASEQVRNIEMQKWELAKQNRAQKEEAEQATPVEADEGKEPEPVAETPETEPEETAADEPKETPKEESKEEPKEAPKEEPNEEPKEASKEEVKEEPKEELKEQPEEKVKEEPKEEPKEKAEGGKAEAVTEQPAAPEKEAEEQPAAEKAEDSAGEEKKE